MDESRKNAMAQPSKHTTERPLPEVPPARKSDSGDYDDIRYPCFEDKNNEAEENTTSTCYRIVRIPSPVEIDSLNQHMYSKDKITNRMLEACHQIAIKGNENTVPATKKDLCENRSIFDINVASNASKVGNTDTDAQIHFMSNDTSCQPESEEVKVLRKKKMTIEGMIKEYPLKITLQTEINELLRVYSSYKKKMVELEIEEENLREGG